MLACSGSSPPSSSGVNEYLGAYSSVWQWHISWWWNRLSQRRELEQRSPRLSTPEQRVRLFQDTIADPSSWFDSDRPLNFESLFRGIYRTASRATEIAGPLSGPWNGVTLRNGVSALVPRVLAPGKPLMNMGNTFAVELGMVDASNRLQNVAPTIPFEVVANFGWCAGALSFAIIGVVWTSVIAFLISPRRLATHPLMPFFITLGSRNRGERRAVPCYAQGPSHHANGRLVGRRLRDEHQEWQTPKPAAVGVTIQPVV